jgi:putative NADH-flavin reductase
LKIAIVGATGNVGPCVVRELVGRGHQVTAITTHPEDVEPHPAVTVLAGDANDPDTLIPQITGHDVVITSIQFRKTDPDTLIEAVKASGAPRYVVAGGSGTLHVPGTTTRIMDTPAFPAAFAQSAAAAARFFDRLRQETELNWTFLSPPPGFGPGERTGTFRLSGDELLSDADGKSVISFADFAIAMVDEIEDPKHPRARFHAAY